MTSGKKTPSPDTPTPRSFPRWLRRINPYLRREDNNPLFEALLRDRYVYHNGAQLSSTSFFILTSTIYVAAFAIVITTHNFILFYAFLLGNIIISLLRKKPKRHLVQLLPKSNEAPSQFLYDVWLTGISGAQIAETFFFQYATRLKYIITFSPLLSAVLFTPIYFLYTNNFQKDIPIAVYLILCFQYLFFEIWLFLASNSIVNMTQNLANLRRQYLAKTRLQRESVKAANITALISTRAVIAGVLAIIIASSLIINAYFFLVVWGIVLIALGIYLRRKRRRYWISKTRLLFEEIEAFDTAYEEYLEREYM